MIIACPQCDTLNRVPQERLTEQPTCGKCKQNLFAAAPIELTSANFINHAHKSELPLVVDFWASWCGPCRMLSPVVDEIAEETPSIKVCKVNVDEQPELAQKYDIMSIPTLISFKDGKLLNSSLGVQPKESILNLLK